jgi:tellurite resistance protein TerC
MDVIGVPLWAWGATVAGLILLVAADLVLGGRQARELRLREAALGAIAFAALAVLFGTALAWIGHPGAAGQFFAGWLTEYSLSVDNLFIFVVLIGRSAMPQELHSRVLLLAIVLALVLRGIFIALGAAALNRFGWILYIFGAFLLYTAARMAFGRGPESEAARDSGLLRVARRIMPVAPAGDASRLTTRIGGRRYATPLLVLIIAIAITDLAFAFDSIPAIFGLTRDPYLVFTANAFALLGLRYLYFLIGGLLGRVPHLSAGLSAILAFIGMKLITEALLESGVHRVGPVPVPHIGTGLSLAIIAAVITTVTVTSLLARGRRTRPVTPKPTTGSRKLRCGDGRHRRRPCGRVPRSPRGSAGYRPRAGPAEQLIRLRVARAGTSGTGWTGRCVSGGRQRPGRRRPLPSRAPR